MSKAGDDVVYSRNRDVWEKLPRGCAILRIERPDQPPMLQWAVRANRKFTGHEDDEGSADASMYTVDNGAGEATNCLISLKENGQVFHVAARYLHDSVSPSSQDQKQTSNPGETEPPKLLVMFGSKKVHLAVEWNENTEAFLSSLAAYQDKRYKLVIAMAQTIQPLLTHEHLDFLAVHRLVVNSEYCLPVSSGPIDNSKIHNISTPHAYFFSLTVNFLPNPRFPPGLELCVDPLWAWRLMKVWNWSVVQYFGCALSELSRTKDLIGHLAGIEGAVVYHGNSLGNLTKTIIKTKPHWYVYVYVSMECACG